MEIPWWKETTYWNELRTKQSTRVTQKAIHFQLEQAKFDIYTNSWQ